MATEKKELTPASKKDVLKKDKAKPASKKARRMDLKKAALSIGRFFKDVVSELKKVTWASRKEFMSYSMAVIVFVLIFSVVIFAMDSAFAPVIQSWIPSLFG